MLLWTVLILLDADPVLIGVIAIALTAGVATALTLLLDKGPQWSALRSPRPLQQIALDFVEFRLELSNALELKFKVFAVIVDYRGEFGGVF